MPSARKQEQPETNNESNGAQLLSERQRDILRKSDLCSQLSPDQVEYFLEWCEARQLNPFLGEAVPSIFRNKLSPMTTIGGLRGVGHDSGQLDGEEPVTWCGRNGEWVDVWLQPEPPVAAKAVIYRKDWTRPATAVVLWNAVCQFRYDKEGNPQPNDTWQRQGPNMLAKCATAAAYRLAFPKRTEAAYIKEEMAESLDPESVESVEAELTRRQNAENARWSEARAHGVEPLAPEAVDYFSGQTSSKAVEVTVELREEQHNDGGKADWESFPLTRISIFRGRTLGSLSLSELKGLSTWMNKVQEGWGSCDADMRGHYRAIRARMDFEKIDEPLPDAQLDEESLESDELPLR